MRTGIAFISWFFLLSLSSAESFAQGPPINTDTPIMLGLEGRGIRTFARFVRKASLLRNGSEIIDDLDRRVTVRTTPIAVPYSPLSDKFQIGLIVPIMDISMSSGNQNISISGIGDIRFFAKYLLYQSDAKNKTIRVATKSGIKVASGDEKKVPALGTGSTDYFLSGVLGWIAGRTGIYIEAIYNINGTDRQFDYGNGLAYNLAFGFRLLPSVYETYPSPQLNGFLEINGSTLRRNRLAGQSVNNSGGTTIFVSPGLQFVVGRRWLIEASFQYPIINEPNGTQLATDWTFSLGTRILIF